jgi:hypothetical protein
MARDDARPTPAGALQKWLERRLDAERTQWLRDALARLAGGGSDRDLFAAVSLASRRLGKAALALDAQELAQAARLREGWDPSGWTVDQAARILLLLVTGSDGGAFARRLDPLCATADVDELVAFYRGLPLYPDAPRHRARAAEGLRSNMLVVYQAVAHANPYPAEQLAEEAWNQMVLKALFVGTALHPIVGLDQRANERLARMLCDYAHERWAASRPISPELWRCVGPLARGGAMLADLQRVLEQGSAPERAAVALALRGAEHTEARALLARHGALAQAVAARGIDWSNISDFTEADDPIQKG